jgi:oligogalacturonide transport system ATP-binding protein
VTFGIRPQHVAPVPAGSPDALTGKVHNIEFMGHEVNLYVTIGDTDFIAVVPNERFDKSLLRGQEVALRPVGARVHIFDQDSGANISLAGE